MDDPAILATGLPCSVIVNVSPALTRSRYIDRWSRNSRTPTVVGSLAGVALFGFFCVVIRGI